MPAEPVRPPEPRDGLGDARRVVVYGVTGSGKSTLAARLSALSGLPYVSVDDECWLPGWVQRDPADMRARFEEICGGGAWILDSAWGVWRDVALARADLVVGLDLPRGLTLARLLRRTVARVLDRREVCGGNTETLRSALGRDSIVAWHFRTFGSKRETLDAWQADPSMPAVLRLRSADEVEAWVDCVAIERSTR